MHRLVSTLGALALAAFCLVACSPAGARPDTDLLAVTAGPQHGIDVDPGGQSPVTLEAIFAGELADVLQSDGLVPLDEGPVLLAAHITIEGEGQAIVEVGPRGGPWEPIAIARPPIVTGLVVERRAGAFARVSISSVDGARIIGGHGPLRSWVTATGLEPNREVRPVPIGG